MPERYIPWGKEPRRRQAESTPNEPVVSELTAEGRENLRQLKRQFSNTVDQSESTLTHFATALHAAKKSEVGSRRKRGLREPYYTDTGVVHDGEHDFGFSFSYHKKKGVIVPDSYIQSLRHVQEQIVYPAYHPNEPSLNVGFTEGKLTSARLDVGHAKSLGEFNNLATKPEKLDKISERLRFALPKDGQTRSINLGVDVQEDQFTFRRNDSAVVYSFDPEQNKFVYVPQMALSYAEEAAEQKDFDTIMTYEPDDVTKYVSEMLSLIPRK